MTIEAMRGALDMTYKAMEQPKVTPYREGYLAGYAAGDAAHNCQDTGCPCYQAGRVAQAGEPRGA